MALTYATTTFNGRVSVAGGKCGTSSDTKSLAAGGQPGTLWEPNRYAGRAGSPGSPEDVLIVESFQYIWPNAATTNYWNLTVSNAWVEVRDGALEVADLVVRNDAVFRADDLANNNPRKSVMAHFSLTDSIHLIGSSWTSSDNRNPVFGGGRLFLTAGANALAGSLTIESGSFLFATGDTSVTNEASGGGTGGDGKIHGLGTTIACSDAYIYGTLSADQRGFPVAQGPGYTVNQPSSHGGRAVSAVYGNATAPTALGSGGTGGAGGGAVKIAASGTIHIDGIISANGVHAHRYSPAGGSIWLVSHTLSGSGIIRAEGGNGQIQAGAAGGRIALDYTTSTFSGRVSVAGGRSGYIGDPLSIAAGGQPGTLWEPRRYAGLAGTPESPAEVFETGSFQYVWPAATPTNYWNLTVSNAWVEMHSGAMVVGELVVQEDAVMRPVMPHFDVTGSIRVSGLSQPPKDSRTPSPLLGGRFHLPAGNYELNELNVGTGSFIYARGATAVTNEASGGGVGGDGKIHGIGPFVRVSGAVINGTVSAAGLGFAPNQGPGSKTSGGYGGSYGGTGNTGGPAYGRLFRPTALGSGGSEYSGGGAFRLEVRGSLALNGSINASGNGYQRSGSGGSIWVTAETLTGAGTLVANGPDATTNPSGGGRIALGYVDGSGWSGTQSVWARTASGAQYGTIVNCVSVDLDAAIEGSGVGTDMQTALSLSSNDRRVDRTITSWGRVMGWSDHAKRASSGADDSNTATYTISGFAPNAKVTVTVNSVVQESLTAADGSGVLVISSVALNPAATVQVELAAKGTVILMR